MSAGMTIAAGAIGGGLAGLVTTGTLKGMLIGAISGAAFAGIGNHFAGIKAANITNGIKTLGNGLTAAQQAGKILMHGLAGGTRAVLSGGKFKDGFVAAGFSQLAAPTIDHIDSSAGQVVAAGVVGGIGSELVGGSFEDGFVTGVFSRAFNDNLHNGWGSKIEGWFKNQFSDFSRASEIMHEELATHGGHNDLSDAQRHANGISRISQEVGPGTALMVGVGHELKGVLFDSQPMNEAIMDMSNNVNGIYHGITGTPINPNDLYVIDPGWNGGYPSTNIYQDSPVAGGF